LDVGGGASFVSLPPPVLGAGGGGVAPGSVLNVLIDGVDVMVLRSSEFRRPVLREKDCRVIHSGAGRRMHP
jgi:hypothetical protein